MMQLNGRSCDAWVARLPQGAGCQRIRFGKIKSQKGIGLAFGKKIEPEGAAEKTVPKKPFYKKLLAPFIALSALLPFASGCVDSQSPYTPAPSGQTSPSRQSDDSRGSNFGIGTNGSGYLNPSGESGGIGIGFDGKIYMDMGGIGIPLN